MWKKRSLENNLIIFLSFYDPMRTKWKLWNYFDGSFRENCSLTEYMNANLTA